jgi:hypothetical protein
MIYATMQRPPQVRSNSGIDCQINPYGATIPQLAPIAVVKFKPSYSNDAIAAIFGISEQRLTEMRLELFESGLLTPGVHYWQSRDGIRWSESSLWRLAYRLDKSAIVTNPGRTPIALLPPATEFSLSSKAVASTLKISVNRLHKLRRSNTSLIEGKHFREAKTATNSTCYQWSDAGLNAVRAIVRGDHV